MTDAGDEADKHPLQDDGYHDSVGHQIMCHASCSLV
jgi:hypothetical protein